MKGDLKEVKDDIREINGDIKSLLARQTEMRQSMSVAEKIFRICGKKQ